jgi:CYTH domain-containing protein
VNLTKANQRVEISDLYFLRTDVSIRVRASDVSPGQQFEVTFKFWNRTGTIEESITVDPQKGRRLFDAGAKTGLQVITKTRYLFHVGAFIWEIDVYSPPLDFFAIAECEYYSRQRPFELLHQPSWYCGTDWHAEKLEITQDMGFFDLMLSGDITALRKYVAHRIPSFDWT